MNIYIVHFLYQDDDRTEDQYAAYLKTDDVDKAREQIEDLPDFDYYESECIANWAEKDDEEDDMYAYLEVEYITDEPEIYESKWFKSLEIILDER